MDTETKLKVMIKDALRCQGNGIKFLEIVDTEAQRERMINAGINPAFVKTWEEIFEIM